MRHPFRDFTATVQPAAPAQAGIRQRSLRRHCRLGRATELVFVLATGAMLVLGGQAQAQQASFFWEGTTSTNTNDPQNWGGFVPSTGANVTIGPNRGLSNEPANFDPTATVSHSWNNLAVLAGATFTIDSIQVLAENLTGGGNLVINADRTFTILNGGNFAGAISGAGTFNKFGGGRLTLSAASRLTGGLRVFGGILDLTGSVASTQVTAIGGELRLATGSVLPTVVVSIAQNDSRVTLTGDLTVGLVSNNSFGSSVLNLNGHVLTLDTNPPQQSLILGSIQGGAGSGIIKTGTSAAVIAGNNSYEGETQINAGVLLAQSAHALGATGIGNGTIVAEGAQLNINARSTDGFTLVEDLTLAGTGVGTNGALYMNNFGVTRASIGVSGKITLAGDTLITASTGDAADVLTLSGDITATNAGTVLTIGGTSATQLGRTTLADGALTKTGTGTLTLGGLLDAPTLNIQGGSVVALRGSLQNSTAINMTTAGTNLTLDRLSSMAQGDFTIGTINATNGTILLRNAAVLDVSGDGNSTIAAPISEEGGAGQLVKSGNGTLVLTGNHTYSGQTRIDAGTLQLGTTAVGFSLGAGGIVNNAALVVATNVNSTLSSVISGSGTVARHAGAGSLTLSGANTYQGVTTVSAGKLIVTHDNALGSTDAGTVVTGSGTLELAGGVTTAEAITLNQTQVSTGGLRGLGTATVSGAITLTSNGRIAADGQQGDVLSLTGGISATGQSLTFAGTQGALVSGGMSLGGGDLFKTLSGSLTIAGMGNSVGITTITEGTVNLTGSLVADDVRLNRVVTRTPTNPRLVIGPDASLTTARVLMTGGTLSYGNGVVFGTEVRANGTTAANGALQLEVLTEDEATQAGQIIDLVGLGVTKTGAGMLTLTGANTISGTVTIAGGVLRVGDGGTTGNLGAAAVTNNATLAFNRSNQVTLGTVISGTGALVQAGTGTVVLTGANSYAGTTTISAGNLVMGDGGTVGRIGTGAVVNNATLTIDRSDSVTLANALSGSGTLVQAGSGTTILSGDSAAFAGETQVDAGVLRVTGNLGGDLAVNNGAMLQGTGTIGGDVVVNAGATLAPGASPGTLTVNGDLLLMADSVTQFELGQANVAGGAQNDLIIVGGNLTLGGTLQISPQPLADGYYRLFNVTGTTTGSFAAIDGIDFLIGTNQVNLLVGEAPTTQSWVGPDGTWNSSNTNWSTGFATTTWGGQSAVFAGDTGGIVTIEGAQTFQDITFETAGYVLNGPGTLVSPTAGGFSNIDTVEDATINAAITGPGGINKIGEGVLTLGAVNSFTGTTDVAEGTLVLAIDDAVAASGAVTIADGAVLDMTDTTQSLTNLTGIGSAALVLGDAGQVILTNSFDTIFAGDISGGDDSGLEKTGPAGLTLTGENSMTGQVSITGGTLTLADQATIAAGRIGIGNGADLVTQGGALAEDMTLAPMQGADVTLNGSETIGQIALEDGAAAGTITLNGTDVVLNLSGTGTDFAGSLTGTGGLTISDGTHRLSGIIANSYEGATQVTGGTLELAGGVAIRDTGAVVLSNDGTLRVVDAETIGQIAGSEDTSLVLDDTLTTGGSDGDTLMAGVISGAGGLTKAGEGVMTLTGVNSYTGATVVEGGTLALTGDGAIASTDISIGADGILRSDGGALASTAEVDVASDGTLALDGDETIASLTNAGAVTLAEGVTLTAEGISNLEMGVINVTSPDGSARIASDGTITNDGQINLLAGDLAIEGDLTQGADGAITITAAGGQITQTGDLLSAGLLALGDGRYQATNITLSGGAVTGSTGAALVATEGFIISAGEIDADVVLTGESYDFTPDADAVLTFAASLTDGSGDSTLTHSGAGTTVLTGTNSYSGQTTISAGNLQIGDGGTSGTLGTGDVVNDGTLTFDRSDDVTIANAISGSGALTQAGRGTTILTGALDYTGLTRITGGRLQLGAVDDSVTLGAITLGADGTLALTGAVSAMGDVINDGRITLGNDTTGDALTINGNLSGNGSFVFDADFVQGLADSLIITGDVLAGSSQRIFINAGEGLPSGRNITLITVNGENNGAFVLDGDFVTAGIFRYVLRVGNVIELVGTVNAVGAVYEAAPRVLADAFGRMESLQQRLGDRVDAHAGWVRLTASRAEVSPETSSSEAVHDSRTSGIAFGRDLAPVGGWTFGLNGRYDVVNADIASPLGNGAISGSAVTLGASAGWIGASGAYLDLQAQTSRIDATLSTDGAGEMADLSGISASGFSIEVGQRLSLGNGDSVIPQAQVSWTSMDGVTFTDQAGNAVTISDQDRLTGRIGLAYEGAMPGQGFGGGKYLVSANLLHDFDPETSVTSFGETLVARAAPTRVELGLGGSLDLAPGSALAGRVNYATALGDRQHNEISAQVKLRFSW
jgi:fibronectin-binding autotransporter adhesin